MGTGATMQGPNLPIGGNLIIHTHSQTDCHREQFGVQYLAQGHFDMWTGGAGNRTTDLLISGPLVLALPPEPQLPQDDEKKYF